MTPPISRLPENDLGAATRPPGVSSLISGFQGFGEKDSRRPDWICLSVHQNHAGNGK